MNTIEIDDSEWSMNQDYTEWTSGDICDWIGMLHSDFEQYGGRAHVMNINGEKFDKLADSSFLRKNLGVKLKCHRIAIMNAVTNRMREYNRIGKHLSNLTNLTEHDTNGKQAILDDNYKTHQEQYEIKVDLKQVVGYSLVLFTKLPKCIVLLTSEMSLVLEQIWAKIEEYVPNCKQSCELTHRGDNNGFITSVQTMTKCDTLWFELTVCGLQY